MRFMLFAAISSSVLIGGFAAHFLATRSTASITQQTVSMSKDTDVHFPLCGQPDDGKVHLPPNWTNFTPPAVGESYIDPVFGCSVKRLTNASKEEAAGGTHLGFMNYYSTFSQVNATDALILIYSDDGSWRITNMDGRVAVPAGKMPNMNNGHPVWDAKNGNVFYSTLGSNLEKVTINGNSVKSATLHTFKEYKGIVSPDAADLSQDGDHIALVGQNSNGTMDVFVWSLSKQTKTSTYTTKCKINGNVAETPQPGCVHKVLLTADNQLSIQFGEDGSDAEQGVRLWDGRGLAHLQDVTNHYDTGYDLKGEPIFIAVGNSRTMAGIKNPCPSGWGLDVRQLPGISSATCLLDKQPSWHVSYRGGASQPWAAISFFDDRKAGPELFKDTQGFQPPSPGNWRLYEDEIVLARVDGAAIYRLAHARSRSAENYWATPRAAISRDGKYLVFSSNMAYPDGCPSSMHIRNECMDVYSIKVH